MCQTAGMTGKRLKYWKYMPNVKGPVVSCFIIQGRSF